MSIRNHLAHPVAPITSVPIAGRPRAGTGALPAAVAPGVMLPDLAHGVERLVETLLTWLDRQRQRRQLIALDNRLLHDIGVSRSDAEREYRKPFWRD